MKFKLLKRKCVYYLFLVNVLFLGLVYALDDSLEAQDNGTGRWMTGPPFRQELAQGSVEEGGTSNVISLHKPRKYAVIKVDPEVDLFAQLPQELRVKIVGYILREYQTSRAFALCNTQCTNLVETEIQKLMSEDAEPIHISNVYLPYHTSYFFPFIEKELLKEYTSYYVFQKNETCAKLSQSAQSLANFYALIKHPSEALYHSIWVSLVTRSRKLEKLQEFRDQLLLSARFQEFWALKLLTIIQSVNLFIQCIPDSTTGICFPKKYSVDQLGHVFCTLDQKKQYYSLETFSRYFSRTRQLELAIFLEKAHRYSAAARIYTFLAQQGNPMALVRLGMFHEYGTGASHNLKIAFHLYSHAAEMENAEAWVRIGRLYERGKGVAQNLEQAFTYYKKASDKESPEGYIHLGRLYERGRWVQKDMTKAIDFFRQAFQKGSPHGALKIANLIKKGRFESFSSDTILEYYQDIRMVDFVKMDLFRGEFYVLHGQNLENKREGMKLLQRACDAGIGKAAYKMGHVYARGIYIKGKVVIPRDRQMARQLYQKAADLDYSRAQVWVGNNYQKGRNYYPQNLSKAIEIYQLVAKSGHFLGRYKMAKLYEKGIGVPQDFDKAMSLYNQVILGKNFRLAHMRVARLYERGLGVPRDITKAIQLYEYAAKKKSKACLRLGQIYEEGVDGVPQDYVQARTYYHDALKLRYQSPEVLRRLAHLWKFGLGGEQNLEEAQKLYRRSDEMKEIMEKIDKFYQL